MAPRICSVARTLDVVGERWSLLVLREVMLGNRRYDGILEATGAPRAVLSQRLNSLVANGILERRSYREAGQRARSEYCPTERGRGLQPVLTALMDWGDRNLAGLADPPATASHDGCGAAVHASLRCDLGHEVPVRDVRVNAT